MATDYKHGSAGVWRAIVNKAFQFNKGIMHGNPNIIVSAGVPNTNEALGTLCWDVTNSDAYIATDGAGTWVKINA